jgi:hypothetical protein
VTIANAKCETLITAGLKAGAARSC